MQPFWVSPQASRPTPTIRRASTGATDYAVDTVPSCVEDFVPPRAARSVFVTQTTNPLQRPTLSPLKIGTLDRLAAACPPLPAGGVDRRRSRGLDNGGRGRCLDGAPSNADETEDGAKPLVARCPVESEGPCRTGRTAPSAAVGRAECRCGGYGCSQANHPTIGVDAGALYPPNRSSIHLLPACNYPEGELPM